jgi:uncharacterized membrane protein
VLRFGHYIGVRRAKLGETARAQHPFEGSRKMKTALVLAAAALAAAALYYAAMWDDPITPAPRCVLGLPLAAGACDKR